MSLPSTPPGLPLRPPPKSPVKIRQVGNLLADADPDMEGVTGAELTASKAGSIMMGNEAIIRDIAPGTAPELKRTVTHILNTIRAENLSKFLAPLSITTQNSDEQPWKAV